MSGSAAGSLTSTAATTETGGASSGRDDIEERILEGPGDYRNLLVTLISGGVGGARMARALARVIEPRLLTVVVNVADDDEVYGVHVAADLDTVMYTLAGIEGPNGWGIDGDTFTVIESLTKLGADTSFRLGDRDLATCLQRTGRLRTGEPLSEVTADLARSLGVESRLLPATDQRLRTKVRVTSGETLDFQEYFVVRGHRDEVAELWYEGADEAVPGPGVVDAIDDADLVVIAPSNPPLSIWPILAVDGIRDALHHHDDVVAVSPLIGGKALKGPADRVMATLGLSPGNEGVLEAYPAILNWLVVDRTDEEDVEALAERGPALLAADTRIADPEAGEHFARWLLGEVAPR